MSCSDVIGFMPSNIIKLHVAVPYLLPICKTSIVILYPVLPIKIG